MNDSLALTFGDRLRRLREAAGLSQEALAERSGLSARGISDLERGLRRQPRLETVRLLADALALEPAERAHLLNAARLMPHLAAEPPVPVAVPRPLTPLVGREREVATVTALLRRVDVRLVTLTGPGGVGKTRLAIAVAEDLRDQFPDGVGFVDLAPLTDPALVVPTIAATIGIRDQASASPLDALAHTLADRRVLLVLDNCEHLLAAASDLAQLLSMTDGLCLLATSRERLALRAEHEAPVAPLAIVETSHGSDLATIATAESVRLFVARARAVQPPFALTDANASAVAGICARLDGLPLAIELAAAWMKVSSPAALLVRLERRLPVLVRGARDLPARQRTLRDAIAWSYDRLLPDEQRRFRQFAIFVGGWTVEAAAAVAHPQGDHDVVGDLAALVDKSLVHRLDLADGSVRFTMLETVREFGLAALHVNVAEQVATGQAHAAAMLRFAERASANLIGPDQSTWDQQLEVDLPNLRAAIAWFRDHGPVEEGLRIVTRLQWFWDRRGQYREALQWLEDLLNKPLPDGRERAAALGIAGMMARRLGDHQRAVALHEQALATYRRCGDRLSIATALSELGDAVLGLGEIDRAEALLRQSLRLLQEQDARWDLATAWHWFGLVAYTRGDRQEATIRLRRARALYAQVDDPDFAIWKRGNLAWLALLQGDLATARELYAAAVADAWQTRDDPRLAWPLMGVGGVAALQGQAVQAARLYGAAEALRAASEGQLRPSMRMIYANLAADCRSTIGEAAWMAAFGAGQSLPPKQIVAEALAVLTVAPAADAARSSVAPGSIDSDPSPGETDAGATLPSGSRLTRRQRDVLRLLVAGNSDREIAAALSISYRTATFHVANILAKLDVPSRTAAVAFALEQHLLEAHDPRRTTPLPPSR